jgi:ubiquinone/menaquinone biosynthesis C-methylase UbiE
MLPFLERIAKQILGKKYLLVDKEAEGLVAKGQFVPMDLNRYKVVDRVRFLLVEKGKYRIEYRADREKVEEGQSPGMLVIDNSRRSYDEFWRTDEIVSRYEEPMRKQFFSEVLDVCEKHIHGKVADIGCGSGCFLKLIQSRLPQCDLYGIDFSSSSVQRCKREISDGAFAIGDIFQLGCHNHAFDTVICMETLEHIEFPEMAIEAIFKVCRDGGTVIITIPNGLYDEYIGHVNFWSEAEFKALLGSYKAEVHYLSDQRDMVFIVKK